jgi:Flagellar protein FliT
MTEALSMFDHYKNAVDVSERMLAAARTDNWESVFELRAEYTSVIDRIRAFDQTVELDAEQSQKRNDYIRRLVATGFMVTELTSQRLTVVKTILGTEAVSVEPAHQH